MKTQTIMISVLILSSCTSMPISPNMTETPEATIVWTLTNTPTPTETPIPTVDPDAPAKYSRFENGIYFLDKTAENGKILTYTWDKDKNGWYTSFFDGYVWDKSKEENEYGPDQLYMNAMIDETIINFPSITHHENTDPQNTLNWTGFFFDILVSKMKQGGVLPKSNTINLSPWDDGSHLFHFDFINSDGQQQWGLWDKSTITIKIRGDYESLKSGVGKNGFSEAKGNPLYGEEISYMVKLWTEDGNLYVDIAPTFMPTNEKQIMEILMFGPAAIMENAVYLKDPTNVEEVANLPDLSEPHSGQTLGFFVLNQKSFRLFDIDPSQ